MPPVYGCISRTAWPGALVLKFIPAASTVNPVRLQLRVQNLFVVGWIFFVVVFNAGLWGIHHVREHPSDLSSCL